MARPYRSRALASPDVARPTRIARPTRGDEWELVGRDEAVVKAWDHWAQQEPNALASAYDQLTSKPAAVSSRQKPLEGKLAVGSYEGRSFRRWQYEVTSGGRVFYFIDDPTLGGKVIPERRGKGPRPRRRVIVDEVHPGHPKSTERKNR
jgi:hypothetical protein